jgi:hypothetical protein
MNYEYGVLVESQDRETQRSWRKPCPSVTPSTTNPTWTGLGSSPGFRCDWPATNRFSHGPPIIRCFVFRRRLVRISAETPSIQTNVSLAIHQSLQTNSVILSYIKPHGFLPHTLRIHYSPITLSLDAVYSELLTV